MGQKFNLERVSPVSATHSLLWVLLRLSCLLTQLIARANTSVNDLQRITGGCPQFCAFSLLTGRGASTVEKHTPFPPASGVPDWGSILCAPPPPPPCTQPVLSTWICSVRGSSSTHSFGYIWATCVSGGQMYFHSFRNGNRGWRKTIFFEAEGDWIEFDA